MKKFKLHTINKDSTNGENLIKSNYVKDKQNELA